MALKVGDKIPAFTAIDNFGNTFDSESLVGSKILVLYFYPKNFTPGCTREAREFKISYHTFEFFGAEVFGVSTGTPEENRAFHEQSELPYRILSDKDGKLSQYFGVKRQMMGLVGGRETLVVDKEGVLRLKFRQLEVLGHVEEALDTVKKIYNEK